MTRTYLTALAVTLAALSPPAIAQTLRPDTSGFPQPAPVTGGGGSSAPGVGTGSDVKIGVAGLTGRGITKNTTLVLRGNGQRHTLNAGGRDVSIHGTGNDILLRGNVRRLTIIGKANRVSANAIERVAIAGAGNAITYRGSKKATVEQSGGHNRVRHLE